MKKRTTIRKANRQDTAFLANCAHETYEQYVEAIGKKPAPMTFDFAAHLGVKEIDVIELDAKPVGFLVWEIQNSCLFLENIAIKLNAQGHGFARKAMNYLEEQANIAKKPAIELYTNEKMTPNLTLYPHLGFVETERRNEHGFKRIYFKKDVT